MSTPGETARLKEAFDLLEKSVEALGDGLLEHARVVAMKLEELSSRVDDAKCRCKNSLKHSEANDASAISSTEQSANDLADGLQSDPSVQDSVGYSSPTAEILSEYEDTSRR